MFEEIADGTIRLDAHGLIREMNPSAERLVGYPAGRLVGRSFAEFLAPRAANEEPLMPDGWPKSVLLPTVSHLPEQIVVLRKADSEDVRTRMTGKVQRDEQRRPAGAVLTFRPMDRNRQRETSSMEVISTVSHELRSPLTSIKGYTNLLMNRWDEVSRDDKMMMLDSVRHDADRVNRLITELLDISRLEMNRLRLRREMIDVRTIAQSVVEKLTMEFPQLETEVDFPGLFPKVYADPGKIEQVLTNLVENACKYASCRDMKITGSLLERDVEVAVTDSGAGISDVDAPHIFTKLYRSRDAKPTGSGLGLWISQGIIHSHGGRLTMETEANVGSTFRFTLPLDAFERVHGYEEVNT